MAIAAKFAADFSDFKVGVTEANAKLDALGASAGRAELKLVKMTDTAKAGGSAASTLGTTYRQFDGVLASMGVNIGPQVRGLEELSTAAKAGGAGMGVMAKAGLVAGAAMAGWQVGRWVADLTGADKIIGDLSASLLGYGDVAVQTAGAQNDVIVKAINAGANSMITYTQAIAFNAAELKKYQAPIEAAGRLQVFEKSLKSVTLEAANLSTTQQALIKEAIELGVSTADIAKGMTISKEAVEIYTDALKRQSDQLEKFSKMATDSAARLAALDAKSVEETAQLWADFGIEKIRQSGTTTDVQIANIKRWRDDEIAKLNQSTADYGKRKDAIIAISKQQTDAQLIDWGVVKEGSIATLQETADKAAATYAYMTQNASLFTREALEAQLQKTRDTAFAASAMGQSYTDAYGKITTGAQQATQAIVQLGGASNPTTPDGKPATAGQTSTGRGGSDTPKPYTRSLSEFDPSIVSMYRKMGLEDWQILNLLLGLANVWDYQATIDAAKPAAPTRAAGPGGSGPGGSGSGSGGRLTGGDGGSVHVTVNNTISGVFDPATRAALATITKEEVLRGIRAGRKLGTA